MLILIKKTIKQQLKLVSPNKKLIFCLIEILIILGESINQG